jgi:hypothetical protein
MEKAIFKFNGGLGALLCSSCRTIIKTGADMSQFEKDAMKGKQVMLPRYCTKCFDNLTKEYTQYHLVRVNDGKMWTADQLKWVKWKKDGRFHKLMARPNIGLSCIVNPQYGASFTWLTTTIESFERISKNELLFKTKNSTYILNKIKVKLSKEIKDDPFQD